MEARRINKKRRRKLTRLLSLLGIVIILGGSIWVTSSGVIPLESATSSESVIPTATRTPTIEATSGADLPASSERIIPPSTVTTGSAPAIQWAQAIITIAQEQISSEPAVSEGLAWWQSGAVNGDFTFEDTITIGERVIDASEHEILVKIPNPEEPTELIIIGEAYVNDSLLYLQTQPVTPPFNVQRWVISNENPQMALRAIAQTLQSNDLALTAAYAPHTNEPAELVFIALQSTGENGTPIPTLTPITTIAPTQTPRPTATRPREAHLQRLVAASVDTFIDIEDEVTSNAVYEFAFGHPRTGLLTWTELGGRVGGQAMSLDKAQDLTIYGLRPNDNSGSTERLFEAAFEDGITRIQDEYVYFQGHRMDEIVYWMVVQAFERGGQLIIVYDDFGSTQAITVIGFEPID